MNPDGDAVVCWGDASDLDGNYDTPLNLKVLCRRVPKGTQGEVQTPSILVNTVNNQADGDDADFLAGVAMDAAGNFVVAWLRQRIDASRTPACGEKYVCFSYDSVSSSTLYEQRFDQNDNPLHLKKKTSAPEDLAIISKQKKLYVLPEMAMDSDGNFVVT